MKQEHDSYVDITGRDHTKEKEGMKHDYERLLNNVKTELVTSNNELRGIISDKDTELSKVTVKLEEQFEMSRVERNDLQETLQKDRYNVELKNRENEQLREAKADFEVERAELLNDMRSLEAENDRMHSENKDQRKKIKKMEHILYGGRK